MSKNKIQVVLGHYLPTTQTFIHRELIGVNQRCELKISYLNKIDQDKLNLDEFEANQLKLNLVLDYLTIPLRHVFGSQDYDSKGFHQLVSTNHKPDVLHFHFGTLAMKLLSRYPLTDIPIVVSFHGYDASKELVSNKNYVKRLKKILSQRNIFPVFCTSSFKTNLEKFDIEFFNEPKILPYGVSIPEKRSVEKEVDNETLFVQVSSFVQKKGHFVTIDAFELFLKNTNRKARLIFGGGGDRLQSVRDYAEKKGLGNEVEFKGWMSQDEIQDLLAQADVFVHHSIVDENGDTEGLPNAILEAMSHDLPILSSYHSGIPDAVTHGENGLLAHEKDIKTYAEQMETISKWDKLPQNRAKVIKHFSNDVHTAGLIKFYDQIIEKSK